MTFMGYGYGQELLRLSLLFYSLFSTLQYKNNESIECQRSPEDIWGGGKHVYLTFAGKNGRSNLLLFLATKGKVERFE